MSCLLSFVNSIHFRGNFAFNLEVYQTGSCLDHCRNMGNILNQPIKEKQIESFEFEGHKGVVVSMQGWRTSMEVSTMKLVS